MWVVVYADSDEKWIKRRFSILDEDYSLVKKLLEKLEKRYFAKEDG
jgi:hypothetical protein